MNLLSSVVVLLVLGVCYAKHSQPKVQVYSRKPGDYGQENVLICHVSGFHPPDITIDLLRNNEVMESSVQSDLSFEKGWDFYLTKYKEFKPQKDESYACRVKHMASTKTYTWEPDM